MSTTKIGLIAMSSALALATAATAQTTPAPAGTPTPTPTATAPTDTSTPTARGTKRSTKRGTAPAATPTPVPTDAAPTGTAPAGTTPTDTFASAPNGTAPAQGAAPGAAPATGAVTPNPTVGGAAMDATKPITTNAAAAPNLTTLVKAVGAADLDATLSGPGPFTVFAPTNEAFTRLAPGTLDTLLKPASKPTLKKVLTYHVVPGTITLADLKARTSATAGKTTLTTVEGEPLQVEVSATAVTLTDVNGNKSYVEIADVRQSNGVVHVVNGVLLPKLGN